MASNFMFSQVTVPFLHVGGTVEIVDFGSVEQTLQAIEGGATFLSLIPWFGFQLIEAARERSPIPNRLRISEVGGDRVPLSYFRRFEEAFGLLPREHVGMTEANTYTVNPLLEEDLRLGSVGTALPEVEVEIRDASRHKQPPGVEGEVWVKTPGRMEEYWGDPEGTRETISEDWVATGDAGYLDEDGYLWLSGRIKHIIICDGDNIHPKEVEQEIAEHPLVERACVFGLPHPRRGEAVAAAVILKDPGDTLSVAELGAYLEDKLTEVKIPKDLLVLESFPEMAGGKLDRAAMAEALRGRRAAQ
jgi:long-chain acyl-CoA synthetase